MAAKNKALHGWTFRLGKIVCIRIFEPVRLPYHKEIVILLLITASSLWLPNQGPSRMGLFSLTPQFVLAQPGMDAFLF